MAPPVGTVGSGFASQARLATVPVEPPDVQVVDPRATRRESVSQVVAECGAAPRNAASVHASAAQREARITLVAVGTPPESALLEDLHGRSERGGKAVFYEDGAASWPVAARCRCLLAGACALLDSERPTFFDELRRWLLRLLQADAASRAEELEIRDIMQQVGIVAESAAMIAVLKKVVRVGRLSDVPALITGETGTGKELIACAIHRLDRKRRGGPLVAVNCGAISPGLVEAELFGHRRGAFTGAEHDRKGLIRSAHGGVLFLDEVSELQLPLQAKLLRVLQEGRVLRVGDDEEVSVDVRVVAASNRSLEAMVRQGTFRADLFHRISVVGVQLPPLRERKEDLLPLLHHFLRKHGPADRPGQGAEVEPEVLEAVSQMAFAGNVRELENLVRSALVQRRDDGWLRLGDLPESVLRQLADGATGTAVANSALNPGADLNLSRALADVERRVLQTALSATHGNRSETARLLGITPRTVYNKVRKYRLETKVTGA